MRWLVTALLALLGGSASAQSCPAPTDSWGDPWSSSVDGLSADDATKIRCALITALRDVDHLRPETRERLRHRQVGPAHLDEARPRIGSFWLSVDDGVVILRDTLFFNEHMRLMVVVRVEKRGARWIATNVSESVAHARRNRP